jgi:hypothetical protein
VKKVPASFRAAVLYGKHLLGNLPSRGRRRSARSLRLPSLTSAMSYLLPTAGASWNTGLSKAIIPGPAKDAAFHVTPIEIGGTSLVGTFIIAGCAALTLYQHRRQRRAAEQRSHQFELVKAAKVAWAELLACRPSVADADSALVRLQKFRADNLISAHRELRLSRSSFGNDDHLYKSYNSLLRGFEGLCQAARDHITALRRVEPLAAAYNPATYNAHVIRALLDADSSFDRILNDNKILLEEVEQRLTSIKTDFDCLPGPADRPAGL